jgi:hypothetical protein
MPCINIYKPLPACGPRIRRFAMEKVHYKLGCLRLADRPFPCWPKRSGSAPDSGQGQMLLATQFI